MNEVFIQRFLHTFRDVYKKHAPGMFRKNTYKLSLPDRHINIIYGIAHPRGFDDIYIRLEKNEIMIDIGFGKSGPVCLVNSKGLCWAEELEDELSTESFFLTTEKQESETLARALYDVAIEKQDFLKVFLLGAIASTQKPNYQL